MYELDISPQAQKEIKKISRLYQQELVDAIDEIKENPYLGKPLMRSLTERYAYKLAVYRIIYKINEKDQKVEVISAGHRSTVYQ